MTNTTRRSFLAALTALPGLKWLKPAKPLSVSGIAIHRASLRHEWDIEVLEEQRRAFERMSAMLDEWNAGYELWPRPKIGCTITVRRPQRYRVAGL